MSKEEGQFVLDVDASNWAAGAVLQQYQDGVLKVIAYSSRMFNDCELKYCITRKELAAMIFGLKQYRQYLLGRKFLVRSDHAALQYLRSAKELIGQQARWLDLLEEFTFDIQHRAGLKHGNADSLSRKIPCEQAGGACPQCRKPGKQLKNQAECFAVTTRAKRRVQDKPSQPEYPPIPPDQSPNAIGLVTSDPPDLPFLPTSPVHVNDQPEPLSRPTLSLQNNPGVQDQLAGGEGVSRRDKRKEKRNVRLQKELAAWSNDFLADKQSTDKELAIVKTWLTEGKKPEWNTARSHSPCVKAYWQQYDSLILKDGVMYRQLETIKPESEVIRQLLLPQTLKNEFLKTVHEGVAGHLGMMKTRVPLGSRAYWFQWRRDVDIYCEKCDLCNQYFRGRTPPKQGQLIPMILGALLERWACDLAGPFPKSASGHTHILTAICVFSKYMILVPLRDKTAISVAKAIMENVFLRFGAGEPLTDNGCEFRNDLLNEICRLMGVARSFTTAYEARTNGVCERSHATVNSMLSKCVSENQRDWTENLSHVAFSYNASVHESTKFSPFFLMHGSEPRWNVDLQIGTEPRTPYSTNDYADLLIKRLEHAHENVREQLKVVAKRMTDWYDRKVFVQHFDIGDEVFVLNLRLYQGLCQKWARRYGYVATIEKKINDVTYQVRCEDWRDKSRIFHVDKLKLRRKKEEIASALQ